MAGMTSLGTHELYDFFECDSAVLNDTSFIRDAMVTAAKECGAKVVTDVFHEFNPHGVSGVVVIAESHLAIHTWPEYGCAAIDVFSCSDKVDLVRLREILAQAMGAGRVSVKRFERGERLVRLRLSSVPL
jgi:S-adenosylmethionine decarboxylase proenzyme